MSFILFFLNIGIRSDLIITVTIKQLQDLGQPPKELAGDAVSFYCSMEIKNCVYAVTLLNKTRCISLTFNFYWYNPCSDSIFLFLLSSLQALTLTWIHSISQEDLGQGRQSSAPSCERVAAWSITST